MNGEPFCYNSRLTVRQLLELRSNGYDLTRILKDHPELRVVGIAAAYTYAAAHPERYADFIEDGGAGLDGDGISFNAYRNQEPFGCLAVMEMPLASLQTGDIDIQAGPPPTPSPTPAASS